MSKVTSVFKWIGIIFVVIIVLGVIGNLSKGKESSNNDNNSTSKTDAFTTAATNLANTITPDTDKKYVQVQQFSGNGAKKTETFKITGDKFKIKYSCEGSLCQAFLKKPNDNLSLDLIMNGTGPLNDETVITKNGEFQIDVNSIGKWSMTVEEWK